jgi:hypothetical protein
MTKRKRKARQVFVPIPEWAQTQDNLIRMRDLLNAENVNAGRGGLHEYRIPSSTHHGRHISGWFGYRPS